MNVFLRIFQMPGVDLGTSYLQLLQVILSHASISASADNIGKGSIFIDEQNTYFYRYLDLPKYKLALG